MDNALLLWINHQWASAPADFLFQWVTSKTLFGLPVLILAVAYFSWRYRADGFKLGIGLMLVVGAADLLGGTIKDTVQANRPCAEIFDQLRHVDTDSGPCANGTTGMPSNHAINFFAAFAFLAVIMRRPAWVAPMFFVAAAVSLSRIYFGLHYPSQVLVGATLGVIWGAVAARWILPRFPFFARLHPKIVQR